MAWRCDEVWLDSEVLWFRERPRTPVAGPAILIPSFATTGPAIAPTFAPSQRLSAAERRRAERRRRLTTRTVPAVALVVGSATMMPLAFLRHGETARATRALPEDPPSQTFRVGPAGAAPVARPARERRMDRAAKKARGADTSFPAPEWREATSRGLPYAGSLTGGTQLPIEGRDWITWNPVTDRAPNLPGRLYGNERTIRAILEAAAAYRDANTGAPRVVVGDISFRDGGDMNEHVSHQNGLDADIYYPRRDGKLRAPRTTAQVDVALAQDLLDHFIAAGAKTIFVGYATGLRGPRSIVVPYPNHENHMHVRFPQPRR